MPQAATATSASTAASQVGKLAQCTASDAMAATPARARGHQGFESSGVGSSCADSPWAISGVKPSERTAARIGPIACGAWVTVSTRCIKLNSKLVTPATPPSFLRSRPSSVGQSICKIRIGVCTPSAPTIRLLTGAIVCDVGGAWEPQQASPAWPGAWGSGCEWPWP